MAAGGFFGRALIIEVSGRAATGTPIELSERVLRSYLGGVGLGTWLLHRLAPPGVDPLAPEAPLSFVFYSLVGTPLTTSAKFAVVAKSPLTRLLTDALASSQFAIAGKLTGHDAIVIRGRADELSVVPVDGEGVRLEAVPELAGPPAAEVWCGRDGPAAAAARPGVAASAPCWERRMSRPCWCERRRRSPSPTRPASSPPPAICASAASGRPPPSTENSARWRICWPSTRSAPCPLATSPPRRSM